MSTTPRGGKPYVWCSWITGLLAAEKECEWAAWFRAHFRYEKVRETDFNSAAWTADHAALVARRRDDLVADGWTVTVESENDFRLHGQTAILSGKADLVARKPGIALVVDCKTGKQRKADYFQVLVYMFALPRCFDDLKGIPIRGEVCYRDSQIAIEPEELNDQCRDRIAKAMRMAGQAVRPLRKPSRSECAFCDIGPADCQDRYVAPADAVMATEF